VIVFGGIGALVGAYLFATRKMAHREAVDRWLLRIPVVGPTLVALALTRFCLALRLTMETGMSITKALRLSLRATGNAAYEAAAEPVHASLKAGGELTEALSSPVLFPEEFRHILAVGEESGRLTEVLRHQAEHYEETSRIRLAALTQVASWGVWLFTAILIIVAIIQIFNKVYLKALSGI
jgi:type IV pilus assembly protein PilC